ncbi:glyoxylate/hydroxypyruvate reductase A [Alsobacter sp. SYSU M60028]|uniref:Glyoxylate/hydroxypyruvate reductase A n=1 Tax=Alsobacter ponti TaxID=2962936 RepID=A0ABT1L9C9_9HYPH|nr:glyoxylate/hydroxypyruvate reductase A [Alsobacter ponti]MCP8938097.1 glyoxylate/hydroxypyruvate reductase A [Alsobacter ponti]
MTLLVALREWDLAAWVARFRRELPGREIVALGDPFDRRAVEYAVSWKHPPGSLAGLPNLEAIFSLGAGVDHLMGDDRLPDVPVVRVVDPDLTSRMSEYVVLHALKILRQQMRYVRQQQERVWQDDRDQPSAADVRVGVMGLGVLGLDAARKLRVMGFDVAGWSRSPKERLDFPAFSGADGLATFLARTDILICLLPLTPDTRGIIDRKLLGGLARGGRVGGAHLVNAGRGGLQVEADILACLKDGTLASATLDVFETEPLPQASPLWDHPRVTVTPHNAAMSDPVTIARLIAEQIRRVEAGEPFQNVVDRTRGY